MHDGPATIRASDLAAAQILEGDRRVPAVRGGPRRRRKRVAPLLRPFRLAADYTGAIAFPASRGPREPSDGLSKNRVAATAYLEENGLVDTGLVYRLLGFGRTGHLELIAAARARLDQLRRRRRAGLARADGRPDAAARPVRQAPDPAGGDGRAQIDPDRFALIRDNIQAARDAAGCPIEIRVAGTALAARRSYRRGPCWAPRPSTPTSTR